LLVLRFALELDRFEPLLEREEPLRADDAPLRDDDPLLRDDDAPLRDDDPLLRDDEPLRDEDALPAFAPDALARDFGFELPPDRLLFPLLPDFLSSVATTYPSSLAVNLRSTVTHPIRLLIRNLGPLGPPSACCKSLCRACSPPTPRRHPMRVTFEEGTF
jgi:hypothetical protein